MHTFTEVRPSLDNYWRAVVLFGRNVASYKFALGKTLLEMAEKGQTFVPLAQLALPFARHLAAHLKHADKQATSRSSRFLDSCRRFNCGEISETEMAEVTARLGFNNVLDAFHVVGNEDIPTRFFLDERKSRQKGIRLTDELFRLSESYQQRNLPAELEARWRLVETAWQLDLPVRALAVAYDADLGCLVAESQCFRRASVTPCKDALNGYQKGKCFYCFADVSLVEGAPDRAEVDHFFPHRLKPFRVADPIDGIWNLVLACQNCNWGEAGKFDRMPALPLLERLHKRNEFLIESHHPLRETLMLQTGETSQQRVAYLNEAHRGAVQLLVQTWRPAHEHEPAF